MKKVLIRTAAVTSLVTALVVSGLSYFAMPKVFGANPQENQQQMQPYAGVTLQPVGYNGPQLQPAYYTPQQQYQSYPQPARPRVYRPATATQSSSVYEPVVRQKRSTAKSVMIVAGSAGAGAGIGALAGGKKGAAIGAISGGVAGLIYDRMTANPKQ
jgi:hypothetical protein